MALTGSAPGFAGGIAGLVDRQTCLRGDAPALVGLEGTAATYAELRRAVRGVGGALREAGIGSRDAVALMAPNGPAMALAFLGVASAAVCAPLNPASTAPELEFYLDDLRARAVIVAEGLPSPVRDVARARGIPVLDLPGMALPRADAASDTEIVADPDDVALVLHTSGTTGRPKTIPLTHANLCASARTIAETLCLRADDRCLNVMPLFHIHGLVGALLASLAAGGTVVCAPGFSPVHFYSWLDRFAPTWYTAVPAIHQDVLGRAPAHAASIAGSRLRLIRSASSPLAPDVMAGLERTFGIPVIEAYGMTEAAHQIASNPLPPATRKPGSVGLPTGCCEVAVLNEEGVVLPPGRTGELAIRGRNVTSARYDGTGAADWLRTGDMGLVDTDGYVYIAGRSKEMINRAGEKIAPREVDEVLRRHPDVREAAACAVPDAKLGEDIVAVVVRQEGARVTERTLRAWVAEHLAPFKVPRRIVFVAEIPKGPTGKVQRVGLAARLGFDAMPEATDYMPASTPTEMLLAGIWCEILHVPRAGRHDNFFELGGDSLGAMEVVAAIDERLGVPLTVRDLVFGSLQQVAAACDESVRTASRPRPARRKLATLLRWTRRATS